MRARARTALIGVVLLFLLFLIARRLGEEDRAASGEVSNSEVAQQLPSDRPNDPPIDGERRSLIPDWKPSEAAPPVPRPAVHDPSEADEPDDPGDPELAEATPAE